MAQKLVFTVYKLEAKKNGSHRAFVFHRYILFFIEIGIGTETDPQVEMDLQWMVSVVETIEIETLIENENITAVNMREIDQGQDKVYYSYLYPFYLWVSSNSLPNN